jgi:nicotinate-nucleotide--dimethylbenzimidazole phosphoribosyltransferase
VAGYFLASHQSAEPAHAYLLKELEISPLVQWDMRLGEGSGGLFVLPILQNACKLVAETSTFEDARVTNPHKKRLEAIDKTASQLPAPVRSDFTDAERAAVYKAILARRDIRVFLPDPIPEEVLGRILMAAHHAPSVGYMQPWNFILIREKQVLKQLQAEVERERVAASAHYQDLQKDYYLRLKLEGLMQAPLTICVTNDTSRGGPHVLGRNTIPETDLMSTSCAIENMWLAARAEGVAMGWVSIYQKRHVQEILNIPAHVEPVALLTVGYTPHFPDIPVLERVGWGKRLDLDTLVYQERWGNLATAVAERNM